MNRNRTATKPQVEVPRSKLSFPRHRPPRPWTPILPSQTQLRRHQHQTQLLAQCRPALHIAAYQAQTPHPLWLIGTNLCAEQRRRMQPGSSTAMAANLNVSKRTP